MLVITYREKNTDGQRSLVLNNLLVFVSVFILSLKINENLVCVRIFIEKGNKNSLRKIYLLQFVIYMYVYMCLIALLLR